MGLQRVRHYLAIKQQQQQQKYIYISHWELIHQLYNFTKMCYVTPVSERTGLSVQ